MSKPSEKSSADVGPHSWFHRWLLLPFSRFLGFFLFLILGPIRSYGKGRIPREGGLLILSNHLADVDPVVVQLACNRPIHFMAKSELFEIPVLKSLIRAYGAFPVKRGEPDRASIRRAVQLLKMGEVVCVFPEGQLSESGELQELKPGIALLARMAACNVICCRLENTNRIMPYGSLIPRPTFRLTKATWSEPTLFGEEATPETIVAWAENQLAKDPAS